MELARSPLLLGTFPCCAASDWEGYQFYISVSLFLKMHETNGCIAEDEESKRLLPVFENRYSHTVMTWTRAAGLGDWKCCYAGF